MLDVLEEEFLMYQAMLDTNIPSKVSEESKCNKNESKTHYGTDMLWNHFRSELTQLSSIALFLLAIGHSNAAEERIFSMIVKNN